MPYVRGGSMSGGKPLKKRITEFFAAIINLIMVFFRTLFDPSFGAQTSGAGRRRSVARPVPARGSGRITGMSEWRDASGAAACGAGG